VAGGVDEVVCCGGGVEGGGVVLGAVAVGAEGDGGREEEDNGLGGLGGASWRGSVGGWLSGAAL
jgi:hypothetical protein